MTLKEIVALIQMKVQVSDDNYKPAITTAIQAVWATMADAAEWWFLGQPKPYEIDLVANQEDYEINDDSVGRMLHITNSEGVPFLTFLDRQTWIKYRAAMAVSLEGLPGFFYKVGRGSGGNIVIRVGPKPTAGSQTGYLHFQERGSAANIEALPDSGILCLQHGVMSILAPPKEVKINQTYTRWDAITYKEDELFSKHLDEFIRREGRVEFTVPQPGFSPDVESGLDEALGVQL